MFLQGLDSLVSQLVVTQCTDSDGFESELSCMIGEIGRGTAQFLAFGEYVPQDFAESYYITFVSRNIFISYFLFLI